MLLTSPYASYADSEDVHSPLLTLENALTEALTNIEVLQSDLAFVIGRNHELTTQLSREQKRYEELLRMTKTREREHELAVREAEEKERTNEDVAQASEHAQTELAEARREVARLARIVKEQRETVLALEQDLLRLKYTPKYEECACVTTRTATDAAERQLQQLKAENQSLSREREKEAAKLLKAERENTKFKAWLKELSGVAVLAEGCEAVLLQEISERLGHRL